MLNALSTFPIIDFLAALLWFWSVNQAWRSKNTEGDVQENVNERALGASVIMGQLGAIITGASIIIVGIGAFVALGIDQIGCPENLHLLYAATWAVFALCMSQYTMATLPTLAPRVNFVRVQSVALLSAMGLFFGLASGVRFLFAVGSILLG
jgi:hypothetical protein